MSGNQFEKKRLAVMQIRYLADYMLEANLLHFASCKTAHCEVTKNLVASAHNLNIPFERVEEEARRVQHETDKLKGCSPVLHALMGSAKEKR